MRRIILFISIVFSLSLNAQNYWESSGCYSDRYQFGSNHPSYYLYGRVDVGLSERFRENARAYYSSLNFNMGLTYVRAFKLHDSFLGQGCPGDSDYHNSNTFPSSSTVTMNAKLFRENENGTYVFIDEIVHQYTFLPSQNVATQFQNQIDNWDVPELDYGGGYKIIFYLTHSHFPNYYDPFYATTSIESGSFTIGNATTIISPDLSQIITDLSPAFNWEERNNAEYKLILGPASDPPDFSFNSNTGTYTITNALYQSNYSSETSLELPEGILETGTEYEVSIICSYDGMEYRGQQSFTTRQNGVISNNIKFYSQVTPNPTNPQNYINTGLPIRFKAKVLNELSQNLSTLQGTLTCTTAGVTVTDGTVGFSNLGSGLSAWCNGEFEIIVDESVVAGTLLEFTMSCNDQIVGGGPWVSSFSFPIAPLENGLIVLLDANNGDSDGIPEPGETL